MKTLRLPRSSANTSCGPIGIPSYLACCKCQPSIEKAETKNTPLRKRTYIKTCRKPWADEKWFGFERRKFAEILNYVDNYAELNDKNASTITMDYNFTTTTTKTSTSPSTSKANNTRPLVKSRLSAFQES